jgi:PAS domain S-box-containing protein
MTSGMQAYSRLSGAILTVAGVLSLLLGTGALLGWHIPHLGFWRLNADPATIGYATALAFVTSGWALIAVARQTPRLVWVGAMLTAGLGIFAVAHHMFRFELGLPTFLPPSDAAGAPLYAALAFSVIGPASLCLIRPPLGGRALLLALLGAVVLGVGVLSLGTLSGTSLQARQGAGPMGLLVALGLALVGGVFILVAWREARMRRPIGRLPLALGVGLIAATLVLWQALLAQEREHVSQVVEAKRVSVQSAVVSRVQVQATRAARLAEHYAEHFVVNGPRLDDWKFHAAFNIAPSEGLEEIAWVDHTMRARSMVSIARPQLLQAREGPRRVWVSTLQAAARRHKPVVSPSFDLVDDGKGFFIAAPAFTDDRLLGFTVVFFHADHFFGDIMENLGEGYGLRVDDDAGEVYVHAGNDDHRLWRQVAELAVPGGAWRMQIQPSTRTIADARSSMPLVALIAGLSSSLLVAIAMYFGRAARARARQVEASNAELSHEVQERRRSEQRFRRLVESAPDAMVIVAADGRILLSNSQTEKVFGYRQEELLGEPVERLMPTRFHDRHIALRGCYHTRPKMRPMGGGLHLEGLRKDGTEFPVEVSLSPIEGEDGILISATIRDVSERRRQERALHQKAELVRLLQEVAVAANEASGINEAVGVALQRICALTGWPAGHLFLCDKDNAQVLVSTNLWHLDDPDRLADFRRETDRSAFATGVELPGSVLERAEAVWITTMCDSPQSPRSHLACAAGIRGAFVFPIMVKSKVAGVLEFFSLIPNEPDRALLDVMSHIGTQLGRVIERQWSEEALRISERQLAAAQQLAQLGSWRWEVARDSVVWSDELYRIYGVEPGTPITYERFLSFVHPEDRDDRKEMIGATIDEGSTFVADYRIIRPDGSQRIIHGEAECVVDAAGAVVALQGICRDVTEERQAEAQIRELNDNLEQRVVERTRQMERARTEAEEARARLAFLAEASSLLAASLDHDTLLANLVRLAVPYLADWCIVDMVGEDDAIKRVKIAARDPDKEELAEAYARSYGPYGDDTRGAVGVIRTGRPEFGTLTDEALALRAQDAAHLADLRRIGPCSYMIVPFLVRDESIGAITLISAESGRAYTEADLHLAEDLARRCTAAMDNVRLYRATEEELAERKRAEEHVRFQAYLLDVVGEAVVATNVHGRIFYWNRFAETLYGWSSLEAVGRAMLDMLPTPTGRERLREIDARVRAGQQWSGEIESCRRDGSVFPAYAIYTPVYDTDECLVGVICVSSDMTARKQAEKSIRAHASQQAAVASLGQRALAGLDLTALFDEAVRLTAGTLEVELSKVLELEGDGQSLSLRAGIGWREGIVGQAWVPAGVESQAGYTLRESGPVVVDDLRAETRFDGSALLHEHDVVSGMSVVIAGGERPFGVLGAHTRERRAFSAEDAHFLQAVANVLATAIQRRRAEDERLELLEREHAARTQAEMAQRRSAFLAQASALLNSSLDYSATLERVAHLAVPEFADLCVVDLLRADHSINRMVAHLDAATEKRLNDLWQRCPPSLDLSEGPAKVMRTHASQLVPEISCSLIDSSAPSEDAKRVALELGLTSYLCVPLIARSEVLGAMTFVATESGRHYGAADLALAEDLAQRCALAVDNALLYLEAEEEIVRRTQTEGLLAEEKERLAVTLHSIGDGVITTDRDGRVSLLNKVAEELTGRRQAESVGQPLASVFRIVDGKTREPRESPVTKVLKSGGIIGLDAQTVLVARDGTERTIADSGAPIRDRDGEIIGVVLVFRDVTEEQKMQEDLQKAQKLESIGLLAGGIAHDFNNILTAILGNMSLAKMYAQPGDKVCEVLTEAEKAFWRARDLTQQLLTFSKGGAPIKKAASIAELLTDTTAFVLRGTNVRCEFSIAEDLWPATFDIGQISQVINNLVINAQQAMPHGGVIAIRAKNVQIGPRQVLPLRKGRYIRFDVEDQGIGIAKEHLPRIFDPYFTTKQTGSGLGLATSYSIIRKHDGHIEVKSTVGRGSLFSIYLPAYGDGSSTRASQPAKALDGSGKVLLMDDEETVCRVGTEILKRLGYSVEATRDGTEMLACYKKAQQAGEPFDLVIMDLTIPGGMGGKEAIAQLIECDPRAKAVVSSGYFNDPVMADHAKFGFLGVIAKPYKVEELAEIVRKLIDTPGRGQT